MLRLVLKSLLALSLVLQGPMPVLAAVSARARADDCMQAMAQGGGAEKKAPCCVGDCAPSACMQACVAGLAAFLAPQASALPRVGPAGMAHAGVEARPPARDEGPPIRPPIG
jgi:hypothetical protein